MPKKRVDRHVSAILRKHPASSRTEASAEAVRLGLVAGDLVLNKRFGTMVALKGTRIIETTLADGVAATKTLDLTYYEEAKAFFS